MSWGEPFPGLPYSVLRTCLPIPGKAKEGPLPAIALSSQSVFHPPSPNCLAETHTTQFGPDKPGRLTAMATSPRFRPTVCPPDRNGNKKTNNPTGRGENACRPRAHIGRRRRASLIFATQTPIPFLPSILRHKNHVLLSRRTLSTSPLLCISRQLTE